MLPLLIISLGAIIVGLVILILGVVGLIAGTGTDGVVVLRNRRVRVGMILILIGVGIFLISLVIVKSPSKPGAPLAKQEKPFQVVSVYPSDGAEVPRTALGRIIFSQRLKGEPDKAISVMAVAEDGTTKPASGWFQSIEDMQSYSGQTFSTVVFRPLMACTKSKIRKTCFDEGTHSIEINQGSILSAAGKPLAACGQTKCQWQFKVKDEFDDQPPEVSMNKEMLWSADSPTANVSLSIKGETEPVSVSLWLDRGLTGAKFLGSAALETGESNVKLLVKDFGEKERHFLTVSVSDSSGNTTEVAGAAEVVKAHCLNTQKDADETAPDCGGADCSICTTIPLKK